MNLSIVVHSFILMHVKKGGGGDNVKVSVIVSDIEWLDMCIQVWRRSNHEVLQSVNVQVHFGFILN